MDRIVDIGTEGLHLSAYRGFLIVSKNRDEVGRIALDDVHAVILHAHGCTWTGTAVAALAERGSPIVFCNNHHSPVAVTLPIAGFHAQGGRMRAQWDAGRPLCKQLWQRIVRAKITMQGALLAFHDRPEAGAFDLLARRVRSGDHDNLEAQAARRYWPALMGPHFRRDREAAGANALLNYGYAVIRATVARAIVAAGLHPTIGIFHTHRGNAFALADDLVEPFRPLVDALICSLIGQGVEALDPAVKRHIARLIAFDLRIGDEMSPVSVAAQRLAQSLARAFERKIADLSLFSPPTREGWTTLTRRLDPFVGE